MPSQMKRPTRTDLAQRNKRSKLSNRGLAAAEGAVDRQGGDFGAGLIRGAAVVTSGVEALGHELFVDEVMAEQTARQLLAAGSRGIKARFTHPGLSADGLGTYVGRFKADPEAASWEDLVDPHGVVRADLHLAEVSHNTPDGDLGGYLMDLAEEDAAAFGTSIVFKRDHGAERKHFSENQDAAGQFASPDPRNVNNYPHARLHQLRAVDAVDTPAANPDGLFHRQAEGAELDALLAYALGVSEDVPELAAFSDIHPERVAQTVQSFISRTGLVIQRSPTTEASMATKQDKTTDTEQTPEQLAAEQKAAEAKLAAEQLAAEEAEAQAKLAAAGDTKAQLARYCQAFGTEQGAKWFMEGKGWDDCVQAQLAALTEENKALTAKLAGIQLGETEPLSGDGTNATNGQKEKQTGLAQFVRFRNGAPAGANDDN